MIGKHPFIGEFHLFAVEGGTAAMTYIFNTMRENHLIKADDTIALGMPTFTPYIGIPRLNDYQLNVVNLNADVENGWQYSKSEFDKLRDPNVKAFFLVNPSNPPSVRSSDESLEYVADIVRERPDLILLTDDVYGTFANDFVSLFALAPKNTILAYSYSKYFGATGWRLGAIATHRDNVLDKLIADPPKDVKKALHARYESITTEPDKLKFIDRPRSPGSAGTVLHPAWLVVPLDSSAGLPPDRAQCAALDFTTDSICRCDAIRKLHRRATRRWLSCAGCGAACLTDCRVSPWRRC